MITLSFSTHPGVSMKCTTLVIFWSTEQSWWSTTLATQIYRPHPPKVFVCGDTWKVWCASRFYFLWVISLLTDAWYFTCILSPLIQSPFLPHISLRFKLVFYNLFLPVISLIQNFMCVPHPTGILGAPVSHPWFDCPGSSTQEGNFLVSE